MTDTEAGERVADVNDWELVVLTRVHRARDSLATVGTHLPEHQRTNAAEALDVVERVLHERPRGLRRLSVWWTGWRVERAWRSLHEAEIYVTAADPDLVAHLPALRERVALGLPPDDQRRTALDGLDEHTPVGTVRAMVTDALRAAFDASDEAHAAARAFRNKLFVAGAVLVVLNTLLGILGFAEPGFIPMCVDKITGDGRICASGADRPMPADLWLTQVMGAAGAVIATVVLLVRRRPSLSPYILIGYQGLIKVLLGALLAVFGVLLLGAGVGDGLIGLRGQAAVLVAALVFGYTQQVGTRLLDNYADRLLDRVRPLPRATQSGD
ncbi:MAG TPA: hypothetical protein VHF06_36460 [Pseudonocardiaceae bacterium]|nr:hypothetical protein [Pseudonocardiaceae bacterium]